MDLPSPKDCGESGRVPCTATFAPMRQSCVAITRPSPRDEPVTQATCPANEFSESMVFFLAVRTGASISRFRSKASASARCGLAARQVYPRDLALFRWTSGRATCRLASENDGRTMSEGANDVCGNMANDVGFPPD